MFGSIIEEIKSTFRSGNTVTKLITINGLIFVFFILFEAFSFNYQTKQNSTLFTTIFYDFLAIPGSAGELLYKPWTLISYMFLHGGFMHFLFNMLWLYWFGRITGDLLGDRRILPLYILGGLAGAVVFVFLYSAILSGNVSPMIGASAAVMAVVFAAGATSPDYIIRLLFIGPVKLKYIVAVVLLLDIIGTMGSNAGGAFAHIGGGLIGLLYVYQLRQGRDIGAWISKIADVMSGNFSWSSDKKPKMTVIHRSPKLSKKKPVVQNKNVDAILEKIKKNGLESLTEEEKEILYQASKD